MTYNAEISYTQDTIQHFGIKGMRWGHRNRKEYLTNRYISKGYNPKAAREKAKKRVNTEGKLKKAALIGGGVALAGLAAYGGYKGVKHLQAKQALRKAENAAVLARIKEGNKRLREQEKELRNMWGKDHDKGVRIQERFKQKAQFVNAFNAANASQSHTGRKIKDVTNSISKSEIGNKSRKLLN
jgi:hypothetical protein|nr:MAG TPA: hypothetical protein [Caudoviricetes sp.]